MEALRVQGRLVGERELEQIRSLIRQYPQWHRTALSQRLCQLWNWRNDVGRLKDMASRTLLLKLHRQGLIQLPPPRRANGNHLRSAFAPNPRQAQFNLPECHPPIQGPLSAIAPVCLELISTRAGRSELSALLRHHHYLGFSGPVGENVQYLARDAQGRVLGAMVFGAAAWKCAPRDRFIGWSAAQRSCRLQLLANQQRFLILPWVRVPHLGSHLLGLATRRLSRDWLARYGHRLWLVETFVEEQRFAGTVYRAAGWIRLGQTTGRTRQDRHHTLQTPLKAIWVRPLHSRFRQTLTTS